jgi:PhnB protein
MSRQPLIDQLDQAIGGILANPDFIPASVDPEITELLRIARDLRYKPRNDFKAILKADLERKAMMSSTATAVTFREGFRTVTPYLLPANAEYVDFLKNVFGAVETERTDTGPGRFHGEYRIDDSMLMIGVGSGMKMPAMLELYVPNVDEVYKRAIDAGCKELESVRDAHWEQGLRLGTVEDPEGNMWVLATRSGKSYIPEGRNALSASLVVKGAAQLIDFLKSAFKAQELHRFEWPGGLYASVKIGASVVGISEASDHEWMRPMPSMVYMYVEDCDALYAQAVRAGGKSISAPKDQFYGDRHGAVQDEWGNQWYIATPVQEATKTTSKVAQLRPTFRTLTPYLLPSNAEYVDFLKNVFDAKQTFRGDTGPNSFHAEFRIGDSMVMAGVGSNRSMPASMIIYVPNVDETYARALKAGGKSVMEIVENYGDRFCGVEDPAGNTWCIATYLGREPIVAQDQLNTITISFNLTDSARFIDFAKRAFNGREIVRYDSPEGKVLHAKIGIGDSAISVGEGNDRWRTKPTMIYTYVEDCDAMYKQAISAGAKSIFEPKDQPYGDRQGGVEDEWGNQWFISTPFRANYQ